MPGILMIYGEQRKLVLKAICQNLSKSKEKYLTSSTYQELQKKLTEVEEKRFETLLESLIYFKSLPISESKQYEHYRYLSLDPASSPCLASESHTLASGKQFVGPFRNLFFISDFADRFSENFALPTLGEERACPQILEYYLNEQIWSDCQAEIEKLEDDLQFDEAEKLKEKFNPLQKYFAWLKFIKESKNLSFRCTWQEQELVVEDGLLLSFGDLQFRRNYTPMEYQKSEKYAVPLDELDEREIIYRFYLNL